MDAARADAAKLSNEAKQASGRDTEAKVKKAAAKLNLKVEASEAKIREALQSARGEIEGVAVGLTQDLVSRLTGIKIDEQDAVKAVKAELNV
jgi:F-type H+-transporting ATPase subunit b